ncbi:MAG: Phosphomannomutase [Candidatus Jorgensenbacteria bacterium GW2011_GWA1_48_13]|uniref:Phosphomannomutase n=2 Tax=Candidatus Joergenseniibacteriota TaxID=1752739 RepID=A0A0G1W930_9BACT|nr:MAG: Phosphomannomutase [Candidatus Jorgensenbacteria bacterium GW2011_GWA1_48_13]KKU99388.1 MAG: Phosphomannomutase [Candidatus Jorgensenbacteria bacterium GW2011_GWC1_48_8]KKW15273.1 MAG: Phosphomannomutase [Candidatus Jorgensenbacteria bacterium GW2011_GWB1_50_10]
MNYANLYVNFLEKQANVKRQLKAVLDCSNGPAGLVLKKLKIPNAQLIILNSKIDGRFPAHGPNPLKARALGDVKREVKKQKADLGIVFDADADRAVFVDNLGRTAPVHAIAYLLSLKTKPPYVGDLYVAQTLKHLKLLSIRESPVGTYFVKKTMKRIGATLAAEFSGHYYFKEMKNADSGILAAIKVMNTLSELPYKMSDFCDFLPEFHFKQWNVRAKRIAVKSRVAKDWFRIVRPSNTEPVIRLFLGSKDKNVFQKELKFLLSLSRA